jgi:hypothetical protein
MQIFTAAPKPATNQSKRAPFNKPKSQSKRSFHNAERAGRSSYGGRSRPKGNL